VSPSTALQEQVLNDTLLFERTGYNPVMFANIMNAGPPQIEAALLALDATSGNASIVTSFDRKEIFGLIYSSEIVLNVTRENVDVAEYYSERWFNDMASQVAYSGYTGKKHEVGWSTHV
jgi:hypothetical protein